MMAACRRDGILARIIDRAARGGNSTPIIIRYVILPRSLPRRYANMAGNVINFN